MTFPQLCKDPETIAVVIFFCFYFYTGSSSACCAAATIIISMAHASANEMLGTRTRTRFLGRRDELLQSYKYLLDHFGSYLSASSSHGYFDIIKEALKDREAGVEKYMTHNHWMCPECAKFLLPPLQFERGIFTEPLAQTNWHNLSPIQTNCPFRARHLLISLPVSAAGHYEKPQYFRPHNYLVQSSSV